MTLKLSSPSSPKSNPHPHPCSNVSFPLSAQISFSTPLHPTHPTVPPFPPISIPPPSSSHILHPTNPSHVLVLFTIPITSPGLGVRTDPCGPSAPPSCPFLLGTSRLLPSLPLPSPIRFVQAPSSSLLYLLPLLSRFRQLKLKRDAARARL